MNADAERVVEICRLPGVARQLVTFFATPKKVTQKKAIPAPPSLRDSLRCSTSQAAAELARSAAQPRAQTVLA